MQTSGYESEPHAGGGAGRVDLLSEEDGDSTVSGAGGSGSDVVLGGDPAEPEEVFQGTKEEDWVAVQRKKKSSHSDTKVRKPPLA